MYKVFLILSLNLFSSVFAAPCGEQHFLAPFAQRAKHLGLNAGYSVSAFDLRTRKMLCLSESRAQEQIYPASTFKVFVVATILNLVEQGKLSLDQTYPITQSNADLECHGRACETWGEGAKKTLKELIDACIMQSNNIATNELMDLASKKRINKKVKELGLIGTVVERKVYSKVDPEPDATGRNLTTAADLSRFYYLLSMSSTVVGEKMKPYFLHLLGHLHSNNRLNAHFGNRTFWHKTGSTSRSGSDAGFYFQDPHTVVVLVGLQESQEAIPRGRADFKILSDLGKKALQTHFH